MTGFDLLEISHAKELCREKRLHNPTKNLLETGLWAPTTLSDIWNYTTPGELKTLASPIPPPQDSSRMHLEKGRSS